MRDILSNVSILDAFMTVSEVTVSIGEAEKLGLYPDQCEPYGTPDDPDEPGEQDLRNA